VWDASSVNIVKTNIITCADNPRYIGYYYPGGFAEYVAIPEEALKAIIL